MMKLKKMVEKQAGKSKHIVYAGMVELVDTLGLEPSALRCAGSSPVPGRVENHSSQSAFLFFKIFPNLFFHLEKANRTRRSAFLSPFFCTIIYFA